MAHKANAGLWENKAHKVCRENVVHKENVAHRENKVHKANVVYKENKAHKANADPKALRGQRAKMAILLSRALITSMEKIMY